MVADSDFPAGGDVEGTSSVFSFFFGVGFLGEAFWFSFFFPGAWCLGDMVIPAICFRFMLLVVGPRGLNDGGSGVFSWVKSMTFLEAWVEAVSLWEEVVSGVEDGLNDLWEIELS